MDLATVGGIALAMLLIWIPIIISGQLAAFIDVGSMMITIGGSIAATVATFALKDTLGAVKVARKAIFADAFDLPQKIDTLIDLGEKARREGILALERELKGIDDDFMKKAIQLAVDGNEVEVIETVMGTEIDYMENRHKIGIAYFEQLGYFAPAFGMIGTLVGLVQMLQALDDPANIGVGMAIALITTFYGSVMANVVFLPIAGKLKLRSNEEILVKNLVVVGILSIQSGDNPRVLRDKLETFVPPEVRKGSNA
ncbi:MAG: MotA/TolQ/ExbB proton channel family protein [Candidatus Cloacimonetes bacterium]|nr:MotA/TolQ/ExbB proton channel family protein [Candidatus Cloacimonadota bacterium]